MIITLSNYKRLYILIIYFIIIYFPPNCCIIIIYDSRHHDIFNDYKKTFFDGSIYYNEQLHLTINIRIFVMLNKILASLKIAK